MNSVSKPICKILDMSLLEYFLQYRNETDQYMDQSLSKVNSLSLCNGF